VCAALYYEISIERFACAGGLRAELAMRRNQYFGIFSILERKQACETREKQNVVAKNKYIFRPTCAKIPDKYLSGLALIFQSD